MRRPSPVFLKWLYNLRLRHPAVPKAYGFPRKAHAFTVASLPLGCAERQRRGPTAKEESQSPAAGKPEAFRTAKRPSRQGHTDRRKLADCPRAIVKSYLRQNTKWLFVAAVGACPQRRDRRQESVLRERRYRLLALLGLFCSLGVSLHLAGRLCRGEALPRPRVALTGLGAVDGLGFNPDPEVEPIGVFVAGAFPSQSGLFSRPWIEQSQLRRSSISTIQATDEKRDDLTSGSGFNGGRAFEDLKRLVAFGPRPSGSKALGQARQWIIRQLKEADAQVEEDHFVAATPEGNVPMTNLLGKFPGMRPQVVIVAGHYDTKRFGDFAFVGANDGASSAAFLLELARVFGRRKNALTYWLVFFDGEEAIKEWSATDSLYGSRHLVEKLTASGEFGRVQGMILVDMIGDAQLDIWRDYNSTPWLADMFFKAARRLGYAKHFRDDQRAIEDDHIPFVNAGVSAVDLIDFDYGPDNSYWHTAKDTVDHCSPLSLTIVGRVVTATLEELEKSPRLK